MQFTLTVAGLTETGAQALASAIEDRPDPPLAVTLNETDEAGRIWNLVAYFASETEAGAALALPPGARVACFPRLLAELRAASH